MRILVSNDDGFFARGLPPLVQALQSLGTVWVVAPEREQSAKSHSLTMHKPLRIKEHPGRGDRWFSVSGTPADCVYMALNHLLPERPDLVVSGINYGSNLGNDVLYSGTVAAAMEACLAEIPAIAASLHLDFRDPEPLHWDTAGAVVRQVAERVVEHGLPRRTLLNVNVPNVAPDALQGVVSCRHGERRYENLVRPGTDPRGRKYFWVAGNHSHFGDDPQTDGPLVERGFASVSPLSADMTDERQLGAMGDWF
jgi:5'-nucleotidase